MLYCRTFPKRCSIVSIWLTQKSHRFDELTLHLNRYLFVGIILFNSLYLKHLKAVSVVGDRKQTNVHFTDNNTNIGLLLYTKAR